MGQAIEARRSKGSYESQAQELQHIASDWLRLTKHNDKVCKVANDISHAGLRYLALEADWCDILRRYGCQEATEFVDDMAHARDCHQVRRIVEEWEERDSLDD